MKRFFLILFFFHLSPKLLGQNFYLKIISKNPTEQLTIDSLNYNRKHNTIKNIENEVLKIKNNLLQKGFLTLQSEELQKQNDTLFTKKFNLGEREKFIYINIKKHKNKLQLEKDTLKLRIEEIEGQLSQFTYLLEKEGYALSHIKLTNHKYFRKKLIAKLEINQDIKRKIDDIIIIGYDKFPKNHLENLKRKFKKTDFNNINLIKLQKELKNYTFVRETKTPEVLFTKDSTKIYSYFEKNKTNTFEGFIGFNNIKNKLKLNGQIDLNLNNILNSGENISIYWKNDGSKQTTFEAKGEVPYFLKSPLIIKARLNIFKQDSIFQSSKSEIEIGYLIKYNTRFFIGYQNSESSDIQNQNTSILSDFQNTFYTLNFTHKKIDETKILNTEKTILNLKIGNGRRYSNNKKNNQLFGEITLAHTLKLNKKNEFFFKSINYHLTSPNYLTNELYRFGGIDNIRGFRENNLQGNTFTSIISEYRYLLNNGFYLHSIIDYGYLEDKSNTTKTNLKTFGIGASILNKNSLLNLIFANGSTSSQKFEIKNSIFQFQVKTLF